MDIDIKINKTIKTGMFIKDNETLVKKEDGKVYSAVFEYDFYLASGWFSENQEKSRTEIFDLAKNLGLKIYSPKDEEIAPPDINPKFGKQILDNNINAIETSRFLVVNTTEKDMGTIFEAGFAFANKIPIIYYCPGLKGGFNLMLAKTARAVATNVRELKIHIFNMLHDENYQYEYKGTIE